MPSLVVDSSALVDLFIGSSASGALFERLFKSHAELHAPDSIDLEFTNAIRKLWRRGLLVDWHVDELAATYSDLAIERHSVRPLLRRIWGLRYNVTPYDAAYIALAEALDVPLITRDAALARAPAHAARIEYID